MIAIPPLPESYATVEVYRTENRFWWHEAIATELRRLLSIGVYPAMNIDGIAMNLHGFTTADTTKYVKQMLIWGELVPAEPLWDYAPDTWVALA